MSGAEKKSAPASNDVKFDYKPRINPFLAAEKVTIKVDTTDVKFDCKPRINPFLTTEKITIKVNTTDVKTGSTPTTALRKESIIDEDGAQVFVVRGWINSELANKMCSKLRTDVKFECHSVQMMGKSIQQPRQIYACGETPTGKHVYSGLSLNLNKWIPEVKEIRDRIEKEYAFPANACLLNEYKDGSQYVGYHSDKEVSQKFLNVVCTVSLGGTRAFLLKHKKTGKLIKVDLNSGDLCIMQGRCQELWKHQIPKRAHADYRISLTYRILE